MESRFSFTKEKLKALPSPEAGQRLTVHDTKATGLQLRVTPAGAKTFSLYRRVKGGQPERITLGRFPAMTVEQARKAAAQLNAEIEGGASPAALKRSIRAELSFENALTEFLAGKRKRDGSPISPKTKKDYQDLLRLHLDGIKGKKLSAIERTEVKAIHAKVSKKSPAQADKCVALVSAVYVYMLDMEFFTGPNPAERVKKNQSVQRDRFLQSDELPAFFKALADMPNQAIAQTLERRAPVSSASMKRSRGRGLAHRQDQERHPSERDLEPGGSVGAEGAERGCGGVSLCVPRHREDRPHRGAERCLGQAAGGRWNRQSANP